MRPSIEIETFYANTKNGFWAADEMLAVAKLCEEWALSFDSNPDEGDTKPKALEIPVDLLTFATTMALFTPSERTGIVFKKHADFLNKNETDWRPTAIGVAWAFGHFLPDHKVDMLTVLSHIPKGSPFDLARRCYGTYEFEVLQDAVAWDNLGVLLKILPEYGAEGDSITYPLLARFPDLEGSEVHRHFVRNALDERELFRALIKNRRNALIGNYTNSLKKVMSKNPKFATLLPGGPTTVPSFTQEDTSNFHRQHDFVNKIRMDADHLARIFFSRSDQKFYITRNAVHVEEVTRAFIEAGIPPVAIISWSIFNKPATEPIVPLSLALGQYAALPPIEQEFYGEVYRQYLKDFTAQDIVESCLENQTIEAAYRLTGDKAILKSASNTVRDTCFGTDLGL